MASADELETARWEYYRKHLPPAVRIKKWSLLVHETGDGPAFYHQDLVDRVEEIEKSVLTDGNFLLERTTVRCFWKRFDDVVGASDGCETHYVLVELHSNGNFHGHPVTWNDLKKKGAKGEGN